MKFKALVEQLLDVARTDAKVSAFLSQELEQIEQEIYWVEYPEIKFRRHVPVDTNYHPGVDTISYRVYDMFGIAKFISNYAGDLPDQSVAGEKFSTNVEGMGASYGYSTQDLRASALSGFSLDREEGRSAMESIERLMDEATAFGSPRFGMQGFLNHPNVPVDVVENDGESASTEWADKSPSLILRDMHALAQAQVDATKEIHPPNTMLLPPAHYGLVNSRYLDSTAQTTILEAFLKTNPYIKTVESWNRLDEAGDDAGPRMMVYKKDPSVAKVAIPMEVVQHEAQRKNLSFRIPMEARFGGVIVKKPLAMRYADGIGTLS